MIAKISWSTLSTMASRASKLSFAMSLGSSLQSCLLVIASGVLSCASVGLLDSASLHISRSRVMAAAAIIVIALGKIGLGMAIALAPIFIPTLMFRATSNLFESWVRFTLGFALIPLIMAGVVGAIVGIGQGLMSQAATAADLEDAAGFIIVGVGAVFMTLQVPTLVNGLSGTITATANGVAMAIGGAGLAVGAAAAGYGGARAIKQAAAPYVGGKIKAHQVGQSASAAGGNYWEGRAAEQERQNSAMSMWK